MYISIVCELFKAVCKENNVGYITKTMNILIKSEK